MCIKLMSYTMKSCEKVIEIINLVLCLKQKSFIFYGEEKSIRLNAKKSVVDDFGKERCSHGLYPYYTIQDMYDGHYLFNLFLDVLPKDLQKIIPNYMLFANDIVLIKESTEAINFKLELWRQTSDWKQRSICIAVLTRDKEYDLKVKMGEDVIPQVSKFKFWDQYFERMGKLMRMSRTKYK
ncbi:hypothetical protein CR513_00248, partial [Mucuna pruriens]